MGATRAFITIKHGEKLVYVNSEKLAEKFLDKLMECGAIDTDHSLEARLKTVEAGLVVQAGIEEATGCHTPCLRTAIKGLRLLNSAGNMAKHGSVLQEVVLPAVPDFPAQELLAQRASGACEKEPTVREKCEELDAEVELLTKLMQEALRAMQPAYASDPVADTMDERNAKTKTPDEAALPASTAHGYVEAANKDPEECEGLTVEGGSDKPTPAKVKIVKGSDSTATRENLHMQTLVLKVDGASVQKKRLAEIKAQVKAQADVMVKEAVRKYGGT